MLAHTTGYSTLYFLHYIYTYIRIEDNRIPKQADHNGHATVPYKLSYYYYYYYYYYNAKRKPGRPRKNWIDTIRQDFKSIGMTWEDAEQSAINREDWRRSVAQCNVSTTWDDLSLSNIDI